MMELSLLGVLNAIGRRITPGKYDHRNWLRIKQIEAFTALLNRRGREKMLEVSPGWNKYWRQFAASYTSVDYPEYDICAGALDEKFDIVIMDQVLEHVASPQKAIANARSMLADRGHLMIAVPFLFRVHGRPNDFARWTEDGLRELLVNAGFEQSNIQSGSWGNIACVKAHIGSKRVLDYGVYRDLSNDPEYPIQAWAFAQLGAS